MSNSTLYVAVYITTLAVTQLSYKGKIPFNYRLHSSGPHVNVCFLLYSIVYTL